MNTDLRVKQKKNYLQGKSIALGVSGGIAAIEAPKLIRELRRFGAEVKVFVSPNTFDFVGKAALEWASTQEVMANFSGQAEHICGQDLVLIAPATLNTINKIFSGIADSPLTTMAASALGQKKPLLLVPTMHESLFNNPFLQKNLSQASQWGIEIIPPKMEEEKAKFPDLETITAQVCRQLSNSPLKGKKILITGGPTPGKIDDLRFITNKFTGSLAIGIATNAYEQGAFVHLLLGNPLTPVPSFLNPVYFEDFFQYQKKILEALKQEYQVGIFSAAVADYVPSEYVSGKIPSGQDWKSIPLKPTTKIIEQVRQNFPDLFMVTFKYEDQVSREELLAIAQSRIGKGYQIVVANRAEEMRETHRAYIIGKEGVIREESSKEEIAQGILEVVGARLK